MTFLNSITGGLTQRWVSKAADAKSQEGDFNVLIPKLDFFLLFLPYFAWLSWDTVS